MARKNRSIKNRTDDIETTTIGPEMPFAITEAYKRLRTNLIYSLSGDDTCHILGVTSSIKNEGKSTTAINLSYAFAETGKNVLLIDADLRLPRLAVTLGIKNSPGLSTLLVEKSNGTKIIPITTLHKNLHIIPSGEVSPNPTELLSSNLFMEMLGFLKEKYDYIIIDLPPIDIVADALIVSDKINGVLFVVRHGSVDKRVLNNCINQLKFHSAKILGFVVNCPGEGKKYRNKYYKRYYKHYKKYSYED